MNPASKQADPRIRIATKIRELAREGRASGRYSLANLLDAIADNEIDEARQEERDATTRKVARE